MQIPAISIKRLVALLALLLAAAALSASAAAQEGLGELGELGEEAGRHALEPPDTSSPRATLRSFLEDAREAWTIFLTSDEPRRERFRQAGRRIRRAALCLDLSQVPPASLDELASETAILLLDVLERIQLPPWSQIPDAQVVEQEGLTRWTIPHTSVVLQRIEEGPRAGEFLFAPKTVERALEFYERTRHLEPRGKAVVDDGYAIFRTHPGWMIPMAWVEALPDWVQGVYLGQALWQWLVFALLLLLSAALVLLVRRWSRRSPRDDSVRSHLRRMAVPVAVLLLCFLLRDLGLRQIGLGGTSVIAVNLALRSIAVLAAAWLTMLVGGAVAEIIVSSPRIHPQSVDAHLVRIAARLVSLVVAVLIVVEGARLLGLPVMGLIAGLGVGGLAVALAAQSTIENFIGSLTIFADRPVRVGDFCRFGEEVGTVEQIGLRSTRIRTLGRSVMTIPNAEFSRLKLDNFSLRDSNLFRTTVSLRYETTPRQLRDVLAGVRKLLLEHPRVLEDPARVRLVEFGRHSFQLEVFAYVDSSDWNEFLGIREELFLQIADAIEAAGTRLAVPAQTAYLARDTVGEPLSSGG
jgi:MscS family membrane protein